MEDNTNIDKIIDELAASTRSPRGKFSAEESYDRLHRKVFARGKRLRLIRFASAAAAVVLLSVLSWSIYNYMTAGHVVTVNTLAETKDIILPDGTEVTLNRYTTFTYPRSFDGENRKVTLSGEAWFEVAHDKSHPFIVMTEKMDLQVLGTQFNVEAYNRDPEIKTMLFEGSVAVSNKEKSRQLILTPNETAVFNKETGEIEKLTDKNIENEIAWREGKFIFINQPLSEIIRELSNAFDTTIEITDASLNDYRMTGRFVDNENLDEILQLLSTVGNFYYLKDGQTILITK